MGMHPMLIILLFITTFTGLTLGDFCDCVLEVRTGSTDCGIGTLNYWGKGFYTANICKGPDHPTVGTSFKVNDDCSTGYLWASNKFCTGNSTQIKSGTCVQLKTNPDGTKLFGKLTCTLRPSACSCDILSYASAKCEGSPKGTQSLVYEEMKCVGSKRDGISTRVAAACSAIDMWDTSATCQGSPKKVSKDCAPLGDLSYGKMTCNEVPGASCDQNLAQACFLKYMSAKMIEDSTCTRMQMMTYCYISHGCTGEILGACEQAYARCRGLVCKHPRIAIDVIEEEQTDYNHHIIRNTTQFVLIGAGSSKAAADKLVKMCKDLLAMGLVFRAIYFTQGTPAQMYGAYVFKMEFPSVAMYVASDLIQMEGAQRMYFAAKNGDNSPANPRGNAVDKFDYMKDIRVLSSAYDLWGSWDVRVWKDFPAATSTSHFTLVQVPALNSYIVGEMVYGLAHMDLGIGVNLIAQCDWIASLQAFKEMVTLSTVIYTGAGMTGPSVPMTPEQLIIENINYLTYARTKYAETCIRGNAVLNIKRKFLDYPDNAERMAAVAAARIPTDPDWLGCDCVANKNPTSCTTQVMPCGV